MNSLRFAKGIRRFRQWPGLKTQHCMIQKVAPKSSSASKRDTSEDENNEPILFFGSEAATWSAKQTRSGGAEERLWYQPYVISASLSIFLIYFCVLREESDIDLKLDGRLVDHVQGLEELQLTVNYKYNKQNGLDNKDVIQRLKELGIDTKSLDDIIEGN